MYFGFYPIIKKYLERLPIIFSWIAKFAVFNVADIFITVPAVILVVYVLFFDKDFLSDKPKEQDHDSDG